MLKGGRIMLKEFRGFAVKGNPGIYAGALFQQAETSGGGAPPAPEPTTKECPYCLSGIPAELKASWIVAVMVTVALTKTKHFVNLFLNLTWNRSSYGLES